DVGFGTDLGTPSGWTPLHFAASHARIEATKRLLLAGADPRRRDSDGAADDGAEPDPMARPDGLA
ncbi:MAG: ankyrin repeat domain-containing protein, partial [Pseudomonadota bacterium]